MSEVAITRRRVVVTGLGVLSGAAVGADAFWSALVASDPPPTFRQVVAFDPRRWMDRRQAQRTARFAQLAVAAGLLARDDAGGAGAGDDPDRTAVVLGTGNGGVAELIAGHVALQEGGPEAVSLLLGAMAMSNAGSANLAFALGARGATFSVASGCASGTHAVAEAFRLVRDGRADVAYGGGSESGLLADGADPLTASLRNLRVHTAGEVCRPFDLHRDGFVYAEGAGVLRLELLDAARARGAQVYAEVLGGANTVDGHDLIHPAPRGQGLQRALRLALAEAGVAPAAVGHVNVHGTGTRHNDQAESDALADVLGLPGPAVTSTKAVTGHPGAAAGAVEAVATVLAVHHRLVPPTQWLTEPDPAITADVVHGSPRRWEPGIAVSTSVGLGGQNGVLVLGPAPIG